MNWIFFGVVLALAAYYAVRYVRENQAYKKKESKKKKAMNPSDLNKMVNRALNSRATEGAGKD